MNVKTKEQQDALVAGVRKWYRERHAERQIDDSKKETATFRWFKKKVWTVVSVYSVQHKPHLPGCC